MPKTLISHSEYSGSWGNRGQGNELQSALEKGLSWVGDKIINFEDYIDDGIAYLVGALPGGQTSQQAVQTARDYRNTMPGEYYTTATGEQKIKPIIVTGLPPVVGFQNPTQLLSLNKTQNIVQKAKTAPKVISYTPQKVKSGTTRVLTTEDFNSPVVHVQGQEAINMFKQYGGINIPENSKLGKQLRAFVPEARERYGLVGNNSITDEEIAQALYKQVLKNHQGAMIDGEPIIGFRGDTKPYTQLKERLSPEELVKVNGTMDNSLGNLFLGEYPGTVAQGGQGTDRYIAHYLEQPNYGIYRVYGSGTGSNALINGKSVRDAEVMLNKDNLRKLYDLETRYGTRSIYKLPKEMTESGVNEINGFMFRTPKIRNSDLEISVLNDDRLAMGLKTKDGKILTGWKGPKTGEIDGPEEAYRELVGKHYSEVLKSAEQRQQGLLKSSGVPVNRDHPLRDEHGHYTYFVLPNFNIRGAKHLLPYDLRVPRNWNDPNIYRVGIPTILGLNMINDDTRD